MRYTVRMSAAIRIIQSLPLVIGLGVLAVIVYVVVAYTQSPLRAKEVLIRVFLVLTSVLSAFFLLATAYAALEGHVTAAEMFGVFLAVAAIALCITLVCRAKFRKNHPSYQEKRQYARTRSHTETRLRNLVQLLKNLGINLGPR